MKGDKMNIKIDSNNLSQIAYVSDVELEQGLENIYLGGNMKDFNAHLINGRTYFPSILIDGENPAEKIYELFLPYMLTHETTHIIINRWEGLQTSKKLDKVDNICKMTLDPYHSFE